MSANVETMFSVRETPWHSLGRIVMDAPASREALELADLDWQVESRNIYSGTGAMIPGYRANVRSTDDAASISKLLSQLYQKHLKKLSLYFLIIADLVLSKML